MGTPALVFLKDENGFYHGTRVNYDGCSLFPILKNNYNTPEKIKELISFGEISVLGERIHPTPGVEHGFNGKREKGVCLFYHRDRGEELNVMRPVGSLIGVKNGYQYYYVFEKGEWTSYRKSY